MEKIKSIHSHELIDGAMSSIHLLQLNQSQIWKVLNYTSLEISYCVCVVRLYQKIIQETYET